MTAKEPSKERNVKRWLGNIFMFWCCIKINVEEKKKELRWSFSPGIFIETQFNLSSKKKNENKKTTFYKTVKYRRHKKRRKMRKINLISLEIPLSRKERKWNTREIECKKFSYYSWTARREAKQQKSIKVYKSYVCSRFLSIARSFPPFSHCFDGKRPDSYYSIFLHSNEKRIIL